MYASHECLFWLVCWCLFVCPVPCVFVKWLVVAALSDEYNIMTGKAKLSHMASSIAVDIVGKCEKACMLESGREEGEGLIK